MHGLNIIVCLKQVPDTESPSSCYRIDSGARRVTPIGIPPVISPFDENALEAGLQLRESHGAKLTAISVGYRLSKAVLMKATSAGADELVLLDDAAFAPENLDGYGTALVLAEAIRKIGKHDLILTGRQAADTNAGVVGLYLSEILGTPAVSFAQKISLDSNKIIIERVIPDGYEVIETSMPSVITVSSEIGELRSLRLKDILDAKNKPLLKWHAEDIQLKEQIRKKLVMEELFEPTRERDCCFIRGKSPAESGEMLAVRLLEDGIL